MLLTTSGRNMALLPLVLMAAFISMVMGAPVGKCALECYNTVFPTAGSGDLTTDLVSFCKTHNDVKDLIPFMSCASNCPGQWPAALDTSPCMSIINASLKSQADASSTDSKSDISDTSQPSSTQPIGEASRLSERQPTQRPHWQPTVCTAPGITCGDTDGEETSSKAKAGESLDTSNAEPAPSLYKRVAEALPKMPSWWPLACTSWGITCAGSSTSGDGSGTPSDGTASASSTTKRDSHVASPDSLQLTSDE